MSDRNVSGSLGVESQLRIGNAPDSVTLTSNGGGTALLVNGSALSSAPSGAAGGALAGTYPNPTLSAATSAASYSLPMASGRWYNPNSTGTTAAPGANARAFMFPVLFGGAFTLNGIAADITIISDVGGKVRFGLYGETAGLPGTLVSDLGTVATDATGATPLVISQAVTAQWYWVCAAFQLQPSVQCTYRSPNLIPTPSRIGLASVGGTATPVGYYFDTGMSGALPGTAGAPTGTVNLASAPSVWLKAA